MASARNSLLLLVILAFTLVSGSRYKFEPFTCRLLNTNYITAESWLEYPIVFEPINRGRLTIWSGSSSLPGSGFKCHASKNGTGAILMEFANFADKLDWTYFDATRGTTLHGISVNHREDIVFRIEIDNSQSRNHLDCNRIKTIEAYHEDDWTSDIRSACKDCRSSIIPLVNSQISEVFRLKLKEQIIDGLYWHLSSLITNQHFSGPIEL